MTDSIAEDRVTLVDSDKESHNEAAGGDATGEKVSGHGRARLLDGTAWARLLNNSGLLVVLVAVVLAEALRVSFPLLTEFADEIGFTTAAGVVPLLFALTLLAAPLGGLAGLRVLLVIGVGGLAIGRAVMQIQETPALAVTLITVFTGFAALAAALRLAVARVGPLTTSAAFFLGLAVDTAIRLGLTTWDAAWRHDAFPMIAGIALPVLLLILLGGVLRRDESRWGADGWQLGTVAGLTLALVTLILANPGYISAASGAGLPTAGAIVIVGLGLAAATPAMRGPASWVAWAVLVAVAALLSGPSGVEGWFVPLIALAGYVALGALFATATVRADAARTTGGWRTGLGAGLGALALVGTILPYQISYDLDALVAIPQLVWPTAAALIVVLLVRAAPASADIRPPRVSRLRWAAALGPVPLLAVPAWLGLSWPTVEVPADDSVAEEASVEEAQLRVATYNLHYSISEAGRLDPEQQARVLEAEGADVVLLQEVVRGWPIGGGLDAASWMSRRLGMDVVYGEAAESRFGNAVMADRPILESWSDTMARGDGPMRRGFVAATVALGDDTLDVWSTHLQHRDDTTATRLDQARQVIETWAGRERTVIGGDFNSAPGEPDLEPWFDDTGLSSAEETAGGALTPTAPADDPERKIDWLLGTPDVEFVAAEVPVTLASDHLPVFATVQFR